MILSFFKENKIDYIYFYEDQTLTFPCYNCFEEASMCLISTNWKCESCKQTGTLLHIIKHLKEENIIEKAKIFNPKSELTHVSKVLYRIEKSYPELHDKLRDLDLRINRIIQYYEKKTL